MFYHQVVIRKFTECRGRQIPTRGKNMAGHVERWRLLAGEADSLPEFFGTHGMTLNDDERERKESIVTVRALLIGFVMVVLLSGVSFFNDCVLRQPLMVGNYFPPAVFGVLILFVLCVNPLLRQLGTRLVLTGRELALIMAMVLIAASISSLGLMNYFPNVQMLPHVFARTEFKRSGVVKMLPQRMLADPNAEDGKGLDMYLQGYTPPANDPQRKMKLGDIPWSAWTRSLLFWCPLLLVFFIAMTGLALVLHRQWADHEHLSYPIARFTGSLLKLGDNALPEIMLKRSFQIGMAIALFYHMSAYLHAWFPKYIPGLPRSFDFRAMMQLFPRVTAGGGHMLFTPSIFFSVIGFAYFFTADVSFAVGIAPWVYCGVVGFLAQYGVSSYGRFLSPSLDASFHAGAFAAIFVTMLYAGRSYYKRILRGTLFLREEKEYQREILGMRIFLLGFLLFVIQLTAVGLDWQLGVLYGLGAVMIFVVIGRIVAETGTFFIHPFFFPCAMLWGFVGEQALGPRTLLIMMVVSSLLIIDPRQ
ncbi:MAG: hypothetical protein D6820_13765, partial [Lentisphaerae bacterium]